MSTMIHLFSEFDEIRFRAEECEKPTVWINTDKLTVSLTLSQADRDALRAALDAADAAAAGRIEQERAA